MNSTNSILFFIFFSNFTNIILKTYSKSDEFWNNNEKYPNPLNWLKISIKPSEIKDATKNELQINEL
jgi:hypothetical protein